MPGSGLTLCCRTEQVPPTISDNQPFYSLRRRISVFVLAATLVTALVVTGVSLHSTRNFFYAKVEQRLPGLLTNTSDQVSQWYGQQLDEITVFGDAPALRELARDIGSEGGQRRTEIEQFLVHLQRNSPQFSTLILLDKDGETIVSVGEKMTFSPAFRKAAGDISDPMLSGIVRTGAGDAQIASVRLTEDSGEHSATLHGVLKLESLSAILKGAQETLAGDFFLVDRNGSYITGTDNRPAGHWFGQPLPIPDATPVVEDYIGDSGERVVGSRIYIPYIEGALVVEESYVETFEPVVATLVRTLAINLGIVCLFSFAAYRIAVSIARPIDALSKGAQRVAQGDTDFAIPEAPSNDEIRVLTQAFNTMTGRLTDQTNQLEESRADLEKANVQLQSQNSQLQRMNMTLEQLSTTDGLTQLYNYRYFQEYLAREEERIKRHGGTLALVLIDIDHFKKWNDMLGHAKGDAILRKVAKLLKGVTRKADLLARYGGDEFVLLAHNISLEGALQLAEKLCGVVAEIDLSTSTGGDPKHVTVSTGLAMYTGDRRKLFDDADRALYRAKAAGRNCVRAAEATEQISAV